MRNVNRSSWYRYFLCALAATLAACSDAALPSQPELEPQRVVVQDSREIDAARAALEDAIDRILPGVEHAGAAPALRAAFASVAQGLNGDARASLRVRLAQAQATVDAHASVDAAASSAEFDAIRLALRATERASRTEQP